MGVGLVNFVNKAGEFLAGLFKPKSKMKITYKKPPRDDHEYNRQKNVKQDEIKPYFR